MIGKPLRARKGGLMVAITNKAAVVMERLIAGVDLHTTDITAGPLKIHYISTIPSGEELISVGYYYEEADGLMADPEIVFIRSEQGGVQKSGKYYEGADPAPTYYPVSYKTDTFAIDKKCVLFDEKNDADTFDRREQKQIAKIASKWIREIGLIQEG